MEILATLFGSLERVRIIGYCISYRNEAYDAKTVAANLDIDIATVRRELKLLASVHLIEPQKYIKKIVKKTKQGEKIEKEKVEGYTLMQTFPYLESFEKMFIGGEEMSGPQLLKVFKKFGTIDLFLISGVFMQESEASVDLLIVGNNLKRKKIEEKVGEIEKFLGYELHFAVFETEEFMYRRLMHDRFVEEIFHHDHEIIVNTIS